MSKLPFSFLAPFSFLLLLLLLMNNTYANKNTSSTTTCSSSSTCGNGISIRYPFWLSNSTTTKYSCGYPEFGLTCSHDGQPIMTLPTDTYYVTDINYDAYTLTLVDIDVVNQSCPRARHNVTLGTLPLYYNTLDLNLSFYFNCSITSNSSRDDDLVPIGCLRSNSSENLSNNNKESYVFVRGNESNYGIDWSVECEEKVEVVVKENEIENGDLVRGFGEAMNKGFVLNWGKVKYCVECEDSDGYCGYSQIDQKMLCFCKDGGFAENRCNKGVSVRNKVIVGVSVFAFTVIVMSIGFGLYKRRQTKRSYAKSYITQSSSYTTSYDSSVVQIDEHGSKYLGAHVFTYSELEEATNHFDASKELGDGGFGTVYYGKLLDGRCVAVKRLYENNYKRVEQFQNEVAILTRLRHQNLVALYGCTSRHSRELLLVYEYIPNGTVADHLHGPRAASPTPLPWNIRLNIAIETASALAYLHASDIIHRDVKTNNILLDDHFCVKVADFGLSRLFPNDVTHISTAPQGTPGYVDPEYHECYQLTDKSDVYSFGVVLIELLSSMPAVDITRHRHEINLATMAINKIHSRKLEELVDPRLGFERDYKVRKEVSAVGELAFQCLQSVKDMRPCMREVVEVLRDIESDGKSKRIVAEVMDICEDDVVLLKNNDDLPPPEASPDSNVVSLSTNSSNSSK